MASVFRYVYLRAAVFGSAQSHVSSRGKQGLQGQMPETQTVGSRVTRRRRRQFVRSKQGESQSHVGGGEKDDDDDDGIPDSRTAASSIIQQELPKRYNCVAAYIQYTQSDHVINARVHSEAASG